MQDQERLDIGKTLAFWREAANRLALIRIHGEYDNVGPVTADDVDAHLESLRRTSERLLDEGTPYVPALIRLFMEADTDLASLLEAYGRDKLQPEQKDAVTTLMKDMPGLWAAATEIKMINDRDRLFDPDEEPDLVSREAIAEAEKKKKRQMDEHGGPWSMKDRPTGAWPDFHSLTIW